MSDGAHLGVTAERALETILGGKGQPEPDERMTVMEMRAWLLNAPAADDPAAMESYDECARALAGEILRWALTNPQQYAHTSSEDLFRVVNAAAAGRLSGLGVTGFQFGWAANAARRCLELPPAANPAII